MSGAINILILVNLKSYQVYYILLVYEEYDITVASFGSGTGIQTRAELCLIAAISSKLSTEPMNEIDCEKWNWEGWSTKYSMSRLSLHIFHLSTSTFTFQLCLLTELGLVDCTSLHYQVFLDKTYIWRKKFYETD